MTESVTRTPPADVAEAQAAVEAAALRVLRSGRYDWGPEVPAFEAELAAWAGVRHAVGANSGTAALKLALLALGIGPGDEVITAPNSDIATTAAISHVGATPVLVDVEPDTLNLDPRRVEAAITPRTRALLPVHLYGHPADLPALTAIAARHHLRVIEDACLALGAAVAGRPVGHWGDITAVSHAPSKHLGAAGTAGSVLTNDPDLAERARLFSGYGQPRANSYRRDLLGAGQHFLVEGLNERLDELQAAILRAKLPFVAGWLERRRAHAAAYSAGLAGLPLQLPVERPGCRHVWRNYVVRAKDRAGVQRRLAEAGIATRRLYVPPLHLQPPYARLGYGPGAFPVAEAAAEQLFCLPLSHDLTDADRDRAIETLHRAVTAA